MIDAIATAVEIALFAYVAIGSLSYSWHRASGCCCPAAKLLRQAERAVERHSQIEAQAEPETEIAPTPEVEEWEFELTAAAFEYETVAAVEIEPQPTSKQALKDLGIRELRKMARGQIRGFMKLNVDQLAERLAMA
jgi:hypothetical protein